jgi:hypothetical protein
LGPIDRATPKRCVLENKQGGFLDKDKTMDNVQKHNTCTFRRSECPKALGKKLRRGNKLRKRSTRVYAATKSSSKVRTRKADKRVKRSVRRDKRLVVR